MASRLNLSSRIEKSLQNVHITVKKDNLDLERKPSTTPDESPVTAVYLSEFGPNRCLTLIFDSAMKQHLARLNELNKNRARDFLSNDSSKRPNIHFDQDKHEDSSGTQDTTLNLKLLYKILDHEIAETNEYLAIVDADLAKHLESQIIDIQLYSLLILSAFLFICVCLWYQNSYSVLLEGSIDGDSNENLQAAEFTEFFKNLGLFLIILFLPLLKFDAEKTDILSNPFWTISWADASKLSEDSPPENDRNSFVNDESGNTILVDSMYINLADFNTIEQQLNSYFSKLDSKDSSKLEKISQEILLLKKKAEQIYRSAETIKALELGEDEPTFDEE